MRTPVELVSHAFRNPEAVRQLSMGDWDRLVRQARQAGLLARLHSLLQKLGYDASIPEVARWHFEAAAFRAATQQAKFRRALKRLRALLAGVESSLIALNGTAYSAARLPAACGHEVETIDLLVSPKNLNGVESTLRAAGWHEVRLPSYEAKYRRRWLHEPRHLRHLRHATVLDLHHAIVPDSARFRPDAQRLRRCALDIPESPGIAVPCAEDRILHAATVLMHDDDLHYGLRNLSDIDLLLRAEMGDSAFWTRLLARAEEMELQRPLFYALRYAKHFFATPVPNEVSDKLASAAPGSITLGLIDAMYMRMLAPHHPNCADSLTPLARHATYLHAHWLRRPPRQLLPHLVRKPFDGAYRHDPKPA